MEKERGEVNRKDIPIGAQLVCSTSTRARRLCVVARAKQSDAGDSKLNKDSRRDNMQCCNV